ncbi:MAG TPA: helix-turn-helix domain-containing protein [Actinocrinis sp.]|uniref:helix-turn-helix transcriptional regulator n=1 Tax=Actinocrinis sp. TaxID=1920516 RepID=UPI002DDCC403|nr:helix-turn-helix domain-containing protein [Actinocrinis sp.]HEV2342691.1 helix-turn-helix domain-containing protein [Actinocrinis sp.]
MARDELLTISEICAELRDDGGKPLSRATFYRWRTLNKAPKCLKLPNGQIRIRRSALERFLDQCAEAA